MGMLQPVWGTTQHGWSYPWPPSLREFEKCQSFVIGYSEMSFLDLQVSLSFLPGVSAIQESRSHWQLSLQQGLCPVPSLYLIAFVSKWSLQPSCRLTSFLKHAFHWSFPISFFDWSHQQPKDCTSQISYGWQTHLVSFDIGAKFTHKMCYCVFYSCHWIALKKEFWYTFMIYRVFHNNC